jgi:PIN domain nuclease of toxin-antitoxin system
MGTRITLDAHTLIWYIHKPSNHRLSNKAFDAIRKAVVEGAIYIPTITLMEIMRLIEKKKYPISFNKLISAIEIHNNFEIVPLTLDIVEISNGFNHVDIHDRTIIATAISTDTELVSNDLAIGKIYDRVLW